MTTEEQSTATGAQYVQLFQKAHQKIVALDRLDEQIAQLIAKRQEGLEELRLLQSQINQELETRINGRGESATRVLAAVASSAAKSESAPNLQNRFSAPSLTSLGSEPLDADDTIDVG